MFLRPVDPTQTELLWGYLSSVPYDENGFINPLSGAPREGFEVQIEKMVLHSNGKDLPEGYVPETHYILWEDERTPVGWFRLRHYLCDSLRTGSGHIGYSIREGYRGRGCGTEGLRLLLREADDLIPETEVYLRCNTSNAASLHVMLKNGGRVTYRDEAHTLVRIPLRKDEPVTRFTSERIRFIRPTPERVEEYMTMVNDPETSRMICGQVRTYTKNDELRWVQRNRRNTDTLFTMIGQETGRLIGNIELMDLKDDSAVMGIVITRAMQDRHLGSEAIRRLLRYAKEELGLRQVRLGVFSFNPRAIRCYENAGFVRTGETPRTAEDGTEYTDIEMTIVL